MLSSVLGRVLERALGRAIDPVAAALREMLDPYRPELHYMRGPGPKWRERHETH